MSTEIKKTARYGKFIIEQAENDSISVKYHNTKEGLREISQQVGFEFDNDWNTRYFGDRLIKFLNNLDSTK